MIRQDYARRITDKRHPFTAARLMLVAMGLALGGILFASLTGCAAPGPCGKLPPVYGTDC